MRKMWSKRVGDPSSEFGYSDGPEKFRRKIRQRVERAEWLWDEFVKFMVDHDVTPHEIREMFVRYYEQFIDGGEG